MYGSLEIGCARLKLKARPALYPQVLLDKLQCGAGMVNVHCSMFICHLRWRFAHFFLKWRAEGASADDK